MGGNHSKHFRFPRSKSLPWTDPNICYKISRPDPSLGPGVLCQWCGTVVIFSERESTLYLCKHCAANFTDENLRPPPPPPPPPHPHPPPHAHPHPVRPSPPVPLPAHQLLHPANNNNSLALPLAPRPRLSARVHPTPVLTSCRTPHHPPPLPPPPPSIHPIVSYPTLSPPSSFAPSSPSSSTAQTSPWGIPKRVRRRSRRRDTGKSTVTYSISG